MRATRGEAAFLAPLSVVAAAVVLAGGIGLRHLPVDLPDLGPWPVAAGVLVALWSLAHPWHVLATSSPQRPAGHEGDPATQPERPRSARASTVSLGRINYLVAYGVLLLVFTSLGVAWLAREEHRPAIRRDYGHVAYMLWLLQLSGPFLVIARRFEAAHSRRGPSAEITARAIPPRIVEW